MQEIATTPNLDKKAKRLVWKKIIEDYNSSGQKQTDYCKQHGIKQDLFCYYLRQWRKAHTINMREEVAKVSFIPMAVTPPQDKWILNIGNELSLELPASLAMEQLSRLILSLRRTQC